MKKKSKQYKLGDMVYILHPDKPRILKVYIISKQEFINVEQEPIYTVASCIDDVGDAKKSYLVVETENIIFRERYIKGEEDEGDEIALFKAKDFFNTENDAVKHMINLSHAENDWCEEDY
jgi:hypothetical protein